MSELKYIENAMQLSFIQNWNLFKIKGHNKN